MKILGIDPGLQKTGWGIIESEGNALRYLASGLIKTNPKSSLPERLAHLDRELASVIALWKPDSAAVEETFVNKNPASALKLGSARGVCVLAPARQNIFVGEYGANLVKKSIVGSGHAAKAQIGMMIKTLLPAIPNPISEDEADALAIAICHAHHARSAIIQKGAAAL